MNWNSNVIFETPFTRKKRRQLWRHVGTHWALDLSWIPEPKRSSDPELKYTDRLAQLIWEDDGGRTDRKNRF
jgi:hypothetical protein